MSEDFSRFFKPGRVHRQIYSDPHSVEREMQRSLKRGAGLEPVSMEEDVVAAMGDSSVPPPDAAFDRQWALTVLERRVIDFMTPPVKWLRDASKDFVAPAE